MPEIKKSCEVTERIAQISQGKTPIYLNRVSWYSRPAVLDLRKWFYDENTDDMLPGKGISLSEAQALKLTQALCEEVFGFTVESVGEAADGTLEVKVIPSDKPPREFEVDEEKRIDIRNDTIDDQIRSEMEAEFEKQMKVNEDD